MTIARKFSSRTRKSTIPRIFKDPRDTRDGFRTGGAKRKQYDLEGVPNAHLYYNKKEDAKIDKKRRKDLKKSLRHEPELSDDSFDAIMQDLTNYALVERGKLFFIEASGKIFLRIGQLEQNHKDQLEDLKDFLGEYMARLCKSHIHKFSRRELALL